MNGSPRAIGLNSSGPRRVALLRRGSKRLVDLILAPPLLCIASPFILLMMILTRATSRGPALYRQVRVGLNGTPFTIYKIRTMYDRNEDRSGARWCAAGDKRVTPLGRLLRFTHLDELPQLWNVLVGDMSLVGPRPERPEFVGQLEQAIPRYRERLAVRPGLTGLAQVYLPADTTLADVQRKLVYDLDYIRNMSLWLDVRLICCSALYIFGVPFHASCRLLRVRAPQQIEEDYRRAITQVTIEPDVSEAEPQSPCPEIRTVLHQLQGEPA